MTPAWRRRVRILAIVVAILFALFCALGFLGVPWLAKRQIESLAASELDRQATLGEVTFNPFTLRGRIADFRLADRAPGRNLVAFDLLDVNVAAESIWKRALVLEEARLVRPRVEIALDATGRSNVQDIVERSAARPAGGGGSAFSVNNLEVEDGTLVFDDPVRGHRTQVTKLAIGIPFLSSRSSDAQIRVHPHLEGVFDGAHFALNGTTSPPFQDIQRATLDIDFDALPLPRYVEYAPLPNGLKLTGGALTTRLVLAFVTWKGTPRGITLSGTARLDGLAVARRDASPVIAARSIAVNVTKLDALDRSAELEHVTIAAPQLDLRRLPDGTLELARLLQPQAAAVAPATPSTPRAAVPKAWSWSVREAKVSEGAIHVVDGSVAPAFETRLTALAISGANLASQGTAGTVEAAFDTAQGAHFAGRGDVNVAARSARGHFALTALAIAPLHPYYRNALALDVRNGTADLAGDFEVGAGEPALFKLQQGSLAATGLDVAVRGEREALARIGNASATGIALDLGARTVAIDRIEAQQGAIKLLRDADGGMHFEHALVATPAAGRAATETASARAWDVVAHQVLLDRFGADFEDRTMEPAVKVRVADARIAAENLATAPGAKAKAEITARIGTRGRVKASAAGTARPFAAEAQVDATAIDLVALRPYVESRTNVVVTRGAMSARGRLTYAGSGPAARLRYAGNVVVSDFDSLDRPGSQALVRWKTLAVTGADLDTAPFKVAVGAVSLDKFYARLILNADGKLNVLQLLAPGTDAAPAPDAPAAASTAPVATPAAPAAAEARDIPATIGRVQLTNGEVEFSDFFVKPNYSAHLMDLDGTVSRLSPGQAGTVEVTAHLDGSAPVDIRGTVNPFAKRLSLDLSAKATDVDLPRLTPYAVKYAGYGIEKGKLSMEVHYKVEDRKLTATNKLVLDQLTFGERVESPTATKLPVLLAVKLLKDRNGVIDLDLPISGTLDDPKFSVWGVIVQIIGNLLVKAATAPFALLGAIVGGGGEQLAYVEFAPGLAVLTPAAEAKLATLSKALADRPALRLEAAGRAIPDADGAGLRRAALERALRVAKQKDLARSGQSAPPLEEIAIGPADTEKYLKGVYRETDLPDKPRNFIGMQKDIPPAEMEQRLLAGYRVDDNTLRELANDRAQAVKDWLAKKGGIAPERLFVVAPKLGAEGVQGEGARTRVDFAIR